MEQPLKATCQTPQKAFLITAGLQRAGQTGSGQQAALVFSGDLNSDFNDGTPGTQSEATASSRHAGSHQAGRGSHPALLLCGDLNCGLSHGTPGSACADAAPPIMSALCLLGCSSPELLLDQLLSHCDFDSSTCMPVTHGTSQQ